MSKYCENGAKDKVDWQTWKLLKRLIFKYLFVQSDLQIIIIVVVGKYYITNRVLWFKKHFSIIYKSDRD